LHSGVDTERFSPRPFHATASQADRPFVIGCVARLDPVKGHSTLIEAFKLLQSDSAINAELRLIGDGPMRATLERQVERAGLAQRVSFLGTRNDLPQQLGELDLFVLASDREGRPTSIMEAMSAGLPVVATNVGSVTELVDDGEDGFIVEAGEPTQLAQAMQSIIQHDELRGKMSAAARKKAVANFSLERMNRDYANFYHDIVSGRIGRRRLSQPASI
jgi:glycosyltransferase involved in cell wall biosynthesis